MIDLLLDTNILIYMLNKDEKYASFAEGLAGKRFGISVISYLEVNMGSEAEKDRDKFLDDFIQIPFDLFVAKQFLEIVKHKNTKTLRHHSTPDIMIAATAVALDVPLATNNPADFKFIRSLKTIKP